MNRHHAGILSIPGFSLDAQISFRRYFVGVFSSKDTTNSISFEAAKNLMKHVQAKGIHGVYTTGIDNNPMKAGRTLFQYIEKLPG